MQCHARPLHSTATHTINNVIFTIQYMGKLSRFMTSGPDGSRNIAIDHVNIDWNCRLSHANAAQTT